MFVEAEQSDLNMLFSNHKKGFAQAVGVSPKI